MPPSAPTDADLARDSSAYYVVEESSIWKATNLGTTPTWTEVATPASLPETGGKFLAVRCSKLTSGLVYALATAIGGRTYCGRSSTAGATWSWTFVQTQTGRDYTATHQSSTSGADGYHEHTHTRLGDDDAPINPICMAIQYNDSYFPDLLGGAADDIISAGDSTFYSTAIGGYANDLWGGNGISQRAAVLNDYFGVGGWVARGDSWATNMYNDPARVKVRIDTNRASTAQSWVFWGYPSYAHALAVAPTNDNYVYIGTSQGIYRSSNGGFNWGALTEEFGANDLLVDDAVAGVVYFWNTEGNLGYFSDAALTYIDGVGTESPDQNTGRIAKFATYMWVLTSGMLKQRYMGAWTTKATGLANEQGLRVYNNGVDLVFADDAGVWYSHDRSSSWTNKKGDLITPATRRIHLVELS